MRRVLPTRRPQSNDGVGSEVDTGTKRSGNMAFSGSRTDLSLTESLGLRSEGREPGARRKKLAGYLKTANDLRQSYFAQDGAGARESHMVEDGPGSFPDAAVVRSGNEELILFPSYARKHVKSKVRASSERAWESKCRQKLTRSIEPASGFSRAGNDRRGVLEAGMG